MARQLRIQYPGAYYHVTSRGNERQDIYRDDLDYQVFIEKLAVSLDVHNVTLLAYVCMTNHFHLFLTTPDGNLSEFMRHFNISYTSAFNRRHKRSGHLYQGRFKAILVDADSYLKDVSRYIHLNPVRIKKYASLPAEETIRILSGYKYSSLKGYINLKARVDFINYKKVLGCFSGDTAEGRRQYRQFVHNGLKGKVSNPFEDSRKKGILGSSGFMEYIRKRYVDKDISGRRELQELKAAREILEPAELIRNFCQRINVGESEICRKGRSSVERAILMELLYRCCNMTQPEIGRLVGGMDYSSVSVARKQLRLQMKKNIRLKQRVDALIKGFSRLKI
jgi:putative transposase